MPAHTDYQSYLLRLWKVQSNGEAWRASLEEVQTSKRHSFASLEEMFSFLKRKTDTDQKINGRKAWANPQDKTEMLAGGGLESSVEKIKTMWVNMKIAKETETFEKEGVPILYSPHNLKIMSSSQGFIDGYTLFLYGDHTQGCSLSIWETRQDAESFFTSPEYAAMVSSVRQFIVDKPVRQGCEVALDIRQVAEG